MRTAIIVAAILLSATAAWAKKPLPEKAKLDAAKLAARDRYFAELKQANPAALKTFLDAADATGDDDARQAALYLVVADAAAENGQWPLAFDAVERLAHHFDYDALAGKIKLLETAGKTKNADARILIVNRLVELIDEAVEAQRFDLAELAAKLGESVAARLRDAKLRKELSTRRSKLEARRRENTVETGELARAEAVLKGDPNDAEANRVLGIRLAADDNWPEALDHLRRADDAELRSAATAEANRPDVAEKQAELADVWWQLADGLENEKQRAALRARAVYWYSRAVAGLKGLPQVRASRRIKLSGEGSVAAAASQTTVDNNTADILLAHGVSLRLVKIPASGDEKVKAFWLAQTELTEPQWSAVMGGLVAARDLPKVYISFSACRAMCAKMNAAPIGRRYKFRLPTRDEFAHACGKPATYSGELTDYCWCRENSPEKIQPVGQKKTNPFALHDLLGNVWEWADDGKFYGMSAWDPIKSPDVAFTSVDLPANYQGQRGDYVGGNVGVRIAADLR